MAFFGRRGRGTAHDRAGGTTAPKDSGYLRDLSDRKLWKRFQAIPREHDADADAEGRAAELAALAGEVARRRPEANSAWYDCGLFAKWRNDWPACMEFNRRALALLAPDSQQGQPDAWNLGIAATALRDWATARRAWSAFGIALPGSDDPAAPVEANFGYAPVRLNAEPRFAGQRLPVIDGDTWHTEVVWGRRLCPARIEIISVPSRDSGHRCGDIVLHDGDTLGTRMLGDQELGVFNEILLWQRSPVPTYLVQVTAPDEDAMTDLVARFEDAGRTAEDWTRNLQMLCKACSEGSPGHVHQHPDPSGSGERSVAVSAQLEQARTLLAVWADAGPGRSCTEPELILA